MIDINTLQSAQEHKASDRDGGDDTDDSEDDESGDKRKKKRREEKKEKRLAKKAKEVVSLNDADQKARTQSPSKQVTDRLTVGRR